MGGVGKSLGRMGMALGTGGMSELSGAGGGGGLGGKLGGKAPDAPDFMALAEKQAVGNHPNQSTPFASSQWTQGPNGQWNQTVGLSGGLQQGADNLMQQIGNQGPIGTGDDARNQAITAAYDQAASRLDPQWSQRGESLKADLANQGLPAGSEAWGAEMGNFGRDRNDAYSSAMANAIGQGTAAGHVAFADNLAAANNPFQQLGMLQGLTQQPGAPGGANYLSAGNLGYQGDLNKYGIQQGGKNSLLSGGANLAALAAMGA